MGTTAFLLLAVALCSRALLDEERTIAIGQLLTWPQDKASASLMAEHVAHVVAGVGIGLGALWIGLSRRRWRLGGLELGALVLSCGAVLAVPVASDKRQALNTAIDVILPLIAAAALYQLLGYRPAWRRALLAVVVATAAANSWRAGAQMYESRRIWNDYQQDKTAFWSQKGKSLDDPQVAIWEDAQRAARPRGFIEGINILSSFLLLGLAATGAALAGCGWRWARRQDRRAADDVPAAGRPQTQPARRHGVAERSPSPDSGGSASPPPYPRTAIIATAVLVPLAAWQLTLLLGVLKTLGAVVGMLAMAATFAVGMRLSDRPKRLAILLATGLILLQTTLVALALAPPGVHRAFLNYWGAGGKIRTIGHRLCFWDSSIRLLAAHPFTGVGPSQFRKHYPVVRPAYSGVVDPWGAHNWLLNMAADWGVLGVLGVLMALGGGGWTVVRAVARPPDDSGRSITAALMPAMLIVVACWAMVASALPRNSWADVLPYPIAVSLVGAAAVSLCRCRGTAGQVILLAALVGVVVHSTVSETSNVVGVMWPFWGVVALAMAWKGHEPATKTAGTFVQRLSGHAGLILAAVAAVAAVGLAIRPMRSIGLMYQAQRVLTKDRSDEAVGLFLAAAAADPLDPLPLSAAAVLREAGTFDKAHLVDHYQNRVALCQAAIQRNPLDYDCWRSLAIARMFLACEVGDFRLVDASIRDMRRALEMNPRWPKGWLELAQMAAVTDSQGGERVALLQIALAAADRALALEDGRPVGTPPALNAQDRARLLELREQLSGRLSAIGRQSAATQPGR